MEGDQAAHRLVRRLAEAEPEVLREAGGRVRLGECLVPAPGEPCDAHEEHLVVRQHEHLSERGGAAPTLLGDRVRASSRRSAARSVSPRYACGVRRIESGSSPASATDSSPAAIDSANSAVELVHRAACRERLHLHRPDAKAARLGECLLGLGERLIERERPQAVLGLPAEGHRRGALVERAGCHRGRERV